MRESILEMQHLYCGYGEYNVLNDITFSVFSGEIISIIGPNGSGKTTLLRAATNILKFEKGEVLINGKSIKNIPEKQFARKVAMVTQSVKISDMTVEEYIMLGRLPYFKKYQFFETKYDEQLIEKYMKLTNTSKIKNKKISEISGGERQLSSIARALVQEPDILLLDEPTSHLDISHQIQILDLINKLNNDMKLTVIMVLHDLNLASEYSDRLILLNPVKCNIFLIGTPWEIINDKSIREIYKISVHVDKNPISGKPFIFLNSKKGEKK